MGRKSGITQRSAAALDEALRFRRAMPVTETVSYRSGNVFPLCPQCGIPLEREYQSFCDRCGQKLDWRQYRPSRAVTVL